MTSGWRSCGWPGGCASSAATTVSASGSSRRWRPSSAWSASTAALTAFSAFLAYELLATRNELQLLGGPET